MQLRSSRSYVSQTRDAGKEDTFGRQRVVAGVKGGCAADVKYQIVGCCIVAEIFVRVVDHLVRT